MTTPRKMPESSTQKPPPSLQDSFFKFVIRFQRFFWDVAGIGIIAFGLVTLLAMLGITAGSVMTPWVTFLRRWLGYGAGFILIVIGIAGLVMVRRTDFSKIKISWGRLLSLELAVFSLLGMLSVWNGVILGRAVQGLDGGLIGWGIATALGVIGPFTRGFLLVIFLVFGGLYGLSLTGPVSGWMARKLEGPEQTLGGMPIETGNVVSFAPVGEQNPLPTTEPPPKVKVKPKTLPPQFQKNFKVESKKQTPKRDQPPRAEILPPLELLVRGQTAKPNERTINLTAGQIEKTLDEFGIPATVIGFQVGPTVTQFAVSPGYMEKGGADDKEIERQKVRVAQIASLRNDLALALSAERLRIEAPVPGRNYIGIEVPNAFSTDVRLRDILETEEFFQIGSPLAIALGKDVSGNPVVADLSRMPHLLIAGTTGSGKSVCISALTTCLAINNSPDELRLVMIDPKKVELVRFNGLPHLLGKVETDLDRIMGVLRWVVAEMDRRYKLLEQYSSRDIASFNKKMSKRKNPPEQQLPRIVVLIDELADLMMSAGDQTEPALVRLAQLARATGIHLVVATQRPSTDVVTGLIKANFPSRLAFAVASGIDSRVILDTGGAESLLGKGDMLFLPPEAGSPIRAQGVMVTDQELERVTRYWEKQYEEKEEPPPWDEMMAEEAVLADRDNLVQRAIEVVRNTQRASASHLQRQLRVGYPRAARLVDQLEELGIIGPSQGSGKDREIFVDMDED